VLLSAVFYFGQRCFDFSVYGSQFVTDVAPLTESKAASLCRSCSLASFAWASLRRSAMAGARNGEGRSVIIAGAWNSEGFSVFMVYSYWAIG